MVHACCTYASPHVYRTPNATFDDALGNQRARAGSHGFAPLAHGARHRRDRRGGARPRSRLGERGATREDRTAHAARHHHFANNQGAATS